jgi:hypothetical protein
MCACSRLLALGLEGGRAKRSSEAMMRVCLACALLGAQAPVA